MARRSRHLLVALALCASAAAVLGHVRLRTSGGNPLRWPGATGIPIVINSAGSDDLTDGSHWTALRMAIDSWSAVPGSRARLVEEVDALQQARSDFESTTLQTIMFHEEGESRLFPSGSGIVAITPLLFFSDGEIIDADVVFNGRDFSFTTSGEPGRFDVQDVGAHELGHFLGLDHTGWAGGTMYPYVDPTIVEHRSLSEDEVKGMREIYPDGSFGRINGRIRRAADDSDVAGAHVVARDAEGRTAGATLSEPDGDFVIRGLDPGVYTVYAVPLDGPVRWYNLNLDPDTIETDFAAATYGQTATISGTNNVSLGTLSVPDDVVMALGSAGERFPKRVVAGTTTTVSVGGVGLFPPATIEASDPDFVITTPVFVGSSVSFQITAPAGEPRGHVDLIVTDSGGEQAMLPAALEITPPPPVVDAVDPAFASAAGGTVLVVTGRGFDAGARIVIGDRVYRDGEPGEATVIDDTTIEVTTAAMQLGTHDVVVIDPSGLEGRLVAGFQASDMPHIETVFPSVASAAGGALVHVTGNGFEAGIAVTIDGVPQTDVTVESATHLSFTLAPGAVGTRTLELQNVGGDPATTPFSYSAEPDPVARAVAPASGSKAGGDVVTISGADFGRAMSVVFGADPLTGTGGVPAARVTFVDASTLSVVTPAHATGTVDVLVVDQATEQASVLTGAFAFKGSSGGGGGCRTAFAGGPGTPRDALLGAWWLLALALVLAARGRASRRLRATGA